MTTVRVAGFLPSTSGFHFANRFPRGPVLEVGIDGLFRLPVGDASRGLCGGMVFAARDLFEAGLAPPRSRTAPQGGSPLFGYLVRRLIASWELPVGVIRYAWWSVLPDAGIAGVALRTVARGWPAIRAELDAGRLCAVGLVRVRTANPVTMSLNHQVLAYGYDLDDAGPVELAVYDPNHPDDDGLRIRFDAHEPGRPIAYGGSGRPVRGFFRTRYRPPRSGAPFEAMGSPGRTMPAGG